MSENEQESTGPHRIERLPAEDAAALESRLQELAGEGYDFYDLVHHRKGQESFADVVCRQAERGLPAGRFVCRQVLMEDPGEFARSLDELHQTGAQIWRILQFRRKNQMHAMVVAFKTEETDGV